MGNSSTSLRLSASYPSRGGVVDRSSRRRKGINTSKKDTEPNKMYVVLSSHKKHVQRRIRVSNSTVVAPTSDGGNTKLHLLFQRDIEVNEIMVRSLLQIDPDMTRVKNSNSGNLPLHEAVLPSRYTTVSNEALFALLDHHPEGASTKNKKGQTPLHLLVQGQTQARDINDSSALVKLERLVKACPEAVMWCDDTGVSPFSCLVSEYSDEICYFLESPYLLGDPAHYEWQDEFVRALSLLVTATNGFREGDKLLHGLLHIRPHCPPELINFVSLWCGRALEERDSDGNLPLHIVAAQTKETFEDEKSSSFRTHCGFETTENEGLFFTILQSMIMGNPESLDERDCNGKLPIQLLSESGSGMTSFESFGLLLVFQPNALCNLGINNERLMPSVLSKLGKDTNFLGTMFETISGHPWIIHAD